MELTQFFSDIKIPLTIIHVISVIIGMGAALLSDILFTFYGQDKKLSAHEIKTLRLLSNIVWWGLVIISISGLGLFLSDPYRYFNSVKFLAKMSILAVLVINGAVLHFYVWKHVIKRGFLTNPKESFMRKVAFTCGAISLISWLAICGLGIIDQVSVSYWFLLTSYAVITIAGIIVSLLVEYRSFSN